MNSGPEFLRMDRRRPLGEFKGRSVGGEAMGLITNPPTADKDGRQSSEMVDIADALGLDGMLWEDFAAVPMRGRAVARCGGVL